MNKINKHIKSDKKKWVLTAVAGGLIVVALVSLFASVGKMQTTEKLNLVDYKVGVINTTTGGVGETNLHIVSKDLLKYEGAEITYNDGATISYKVAFYDEDKDFLGITSALQADFDATTAIPQAVDSDDIVYFRLEITPQAIDDEAVKVNIFNISNYTNQLSVVVAK